MTFSVSELEKRIYVILPRSVETATGKIVQVPGRQIAQACHVSSKLRHEVGLTSREVVVGAKKPLFVPKYQDITTIILEARDVAELRHVASLLLHANIQTSWFMDSNDEVYGKNVTPITALATYAYPSAVFGILDYLPLWGSSN